MPGHERQRQRHDARAHKHARAHRPPSRVALARAQPPEGVQHDDAAQAGVGEDEPLADALDGAAHEAVVRGAGAGQQEEGDAVVGDGAADGGARGAADGGLGGDVDGGGEGGEGGGEGGEADGEGGGGAEEEGGEGEGVEEEDGEEEGEEDALVERVGGGVGFGEGG